VSGAPARAARPVAATSAGGRAGCDHPPARCAQLHDLRACGRLEAIVGQHQPGGFTHGADELLVVQQRGIVDERGDALSVLFDHRSGATVLRGGKRDRTAFEVDVPLAGREPVRDFEGRVTQRAGELIARARGAARRPELDDQVRDAGARRARRRRSEEYGPGTKGDLVRVQCRAGIARRHISQRGGRRDRQCGAEGEHGTCQTRRSAQRERGEQHRDRHVQLTMSVAEDHRVRVAGRDGDRGKHGCGTQTGAAGHRGHGRMHQGPAVRVGQRGRKVGREPGEAGRA
jgi:hypothetical protein